MIWDSETSKSIAPNKKHPRSLCPSSIHLNVAKEILSLFSDRTKLAVLWYRVCFMYHLGKLLYISAYDGLQMMAVESKPSLQSLWFWESHTFFRERKSAKSTTIYQNKKRLEPIRPKQGALEIWKMMQVVPFFSSSFFPRTFYWRL